MLYGSRSLILSFCKNGFFENVWWNAPKNKITSKTKRSAPIFLLPWATDSQKEWLSRSNTGKLVGIRAISCHTTISWLPYEKGRKTGIQSVILSISQFSRSVMHSSWDILYTVNCFIRSFFIRIYIRVEPSMFLKIWQISALKVS